MAPSEVGRTGNWYRYSHHRHPSTERLQTQGAVMRLFIMLILGCAFGLPVIADDGPCGDGVNGKPHPYGGSFVADTAYIGPDAKVCGRAKVLGNAEVSDEAIISEKSHVSGNAKISGHTIIFGYARVHGEAKVYGNAKVYGRAEVREGEVYGNTNVSGS